MLTLAAQAQTYTFTATTGAYEYLTDSISLNNGLTWDDPQFTIPIGFDFQFFDTTVNQIFISENGGGGLLTFDDTDTGIHPILVAYAEDLMDRAADTINYEDEPGALSPISYKLVGDPGHRILKIEWKNAGFFDDIYEDNVSTDYVNFQLWLYEGTNDIEIHFGPNAITQPDLDYWTGKGPAIALVPHFDFDNGDIVGSALLLSGVPYAPELNQVSSDFETYSLDGTIPDGTIYKFSFHPDGVSELAAGAAIVSVFPNPAGDVIYILHRQSASAIHKIIIRDLNGRAVKTINQPSGRVDISALPPGPYVVFAHTASGVIAKKLIKE